MANHDQVRPFTAVPPKTEVFSVAEFCAAHRLSRAMFYRLPPSLRPTTFCVGKRRLISKEAAAAWRAAMEARSA